MKKINVAVIGIGSMGRNHIRVYNQLKNVKLIAVCDLNSKLGEKAANDYNTRFFKNYRDLIEPDLNVEAVSIAVPTRFHKEVASFFLKNSIPVLLEKPISDSLESAKEIIKTAKKHRTKLAVGHVERFNPAVLALKRIIEKGRLGRIISVISRRVGVFPPVIGDANVFIDLGVHDVDIISYILNEQPKEVFIYGKRIHAKSQEDVGEMFLLYKNTTAFIQVNWITPIKIRKLMVTGTKGYAELDYISQDLILHKAKIKKSVNTFAEFIQFSGTSFTKIPIKKREPLELEIENFMHSVKTKSEPQVTGDMTIKALEICLRKNSNKEY